MNDKPMTQEELATIRTIMGKTTPGNWYAYDGRFSDYGIKSFDGGKEVVGRLLAEVERLHGEVARLDKEADWLVKVLSLFTEECPYRFYLVYEEKIPIPPVDGCEWQWPECHECDITKKYPGKCWRESAHKAVEDENV